MNDIRLTPQLSAFILNVKKYISQKKLSIDEFFYEIKLSNPKRITPQEFARIVQRINQSGVPVNTSALFAQLSKGSAVIPRQTFISSFFKVFKIDRIHLQGQSMLMKPKGSRVVEKVVTPPNPIEVQAKRKALFGLTRLKHHMQNKKEIFNKIFIDCDVNKSGTIDKVEFNKLLFASGIKEFKDKDVRRHLVHYVFDELLKKELMEKPQFFSVLEFKREVPKERSMTINREGKAFSIKRSTKTIQFTEIYKGENTQQVVFYGDRRPNRQPRGYDIYPEEEDYNDYINDYADDPYDQSEFIPNNRRRFEPRGDEYIPYDDGYSDQGSGQGYDSRSYSGSGDSYDEPQYDNRRVRPRIRPRDPIDDPYDNPRIRPKPRPRIRNEQDPYDNQIRIRPKPRIRPINPNQQDPYDIPRVRPRPVRPGRDQQDPEDNRRIKPKPRVRPIDPIGQQDPYDNPRIKPKPKIRPIDPYDQDPQNRIKPKIKKPKNDPRNPQNDEAPKFQITKNKEENVKAYPNAGKYYRLGIPSAQDKPYLQELQRLISSKKEFEDKKNPQANGQYISSKDIFNGPFQLIELSAQEMNSKRNELKIGSFIQANDIKQGQVGDCYFMCAVGSVAAIYPQIISQLFLFEVNPAGYHVLKMFVDGEWKYLKTDDWFVCKPGSYLPMYAIPNQHQIWVMLIQKCFAKIYGSFHAIEGGLSNQAFFALTGAPALSIFFNSFKDERAIKDMIIDGQKNKYLMATGGGEYLSSLSQQQREKIGLVKQHAYSLISITQIQGEVTLVKMRNPWGRFEWKGDWSYDSDLWTPQLREKVGQKSTRPQDGNFFMCWQDYFKYFGQLSICKINPMNVHTSIKLNGNKRQSNYLRMTVTKEGFYHVFTCQESIRKYQGKDYRYSNARVIVLKEGGAEGLEFVGARAQAMDAVCSAQVKLTPGTYLVSAKMQWALWEDREYLLSVYGVQKVTLEQIDRKIAPEFKQAIFSGFATANRKQAKVRQVGYNGVESESHISGKDGLGYMKIINRSNKAVTVRANFMLVGMKLALQKKNTYVTTLRGREEDIVGFFVHPVLSQFQVLFSVMPAGR